MKVLEIFSGTGSVKKICDIYGWDCVSIDITDKLGHVDYKEDILKFDYKAEFEVGQFDFIWASPPCASFSSMLYIHKHIDIEKRMKDIGLPLLNKTREIIDYLKPKYYCIENPKTGRMKRFITDLPYYDVCYCRYGYSYKKPTRIWTNIPNFNALYCNHKGKHANAISHTRKTPHDQFTINTNTIKFTLAQKYSIPSQLIIGIFEAIKNNELV